MELYEILKKIGNEFFSEKQTDFTGNAFLGNLKSIPLPQELSGRYKSDGSVGQGNWAEIPWVAVFDEKISTSAQYGYYIVFLFSADMRKIYLSLNQGYTYFRKRYSRDAKNNIKKVAEYWKNNLRIPNDFNIKQINLEGKSKSDLWKGYELGNICSKCYYLDDFPTKEILHKDVLQLIEVFENLKSKIMVNYEETNKLILSGLDFDLEEIKKQSEGMPFEDCEANITDPPKFSNRKTAEKKPRITKNRDYDKEHKENRAKGILGEKAIYSIEKKKLSKLEFRGKKVEHTSLEKGDGYGYDIKSFDENDGETIYIEVKTTSQGKNSEFYFTDAELRVSKEKGDRYYIYRIYNFNPKSKIIDFYKLQGPLEDKMTLVPYTYKVRLGQGDHNLVY